MISKEEAYSKVSELVERFTEPLSSYKQLTGFLEKIEQLNQRAYTDEKINKQVYELYGLSEEEIGIVEGR
jgi:hypothetical protein